MEGICARPVPRATTDQGVVLIVPGATVTETLISVKTSQVHFNYSFEKNLHTIFQVSNTFICGKYEEFQDHNIWYLVNKVYNHMCHKNQFYNT